MLTLTEVSQELRSALGRSGLTQARLAEDAGVSARTLTHVLSGQEDFRLTTLLSLADRLGLDLLLVPKGASPAVGAGHTAEPAVRSLVSQALDRLYEADAGPDAPPKAR